MVYAFQRQQPLRPWLQLTPANAQGEYYLTDVLTSPQQGLVVAVQLCDRETVLGSIIGPVARTDRAAGFGGINAGGVTIIDPNQPLLKRG